MDNLQFWQKEFDNKTVAKDFAGREIHRDASAHSQYSWNIDHISPTNSNGPNTQDNMQITHVKTNEEKGDKNTFTINGTQYQVKKTKKTLDSEWADYDYTNKKYCIVVVE